MEMTPRTMIEIVPAPAMTAGIVNTPVPTMLPMTSAVAEGKPRARAALAAGGGGVASGTSGVSIRASAI